MTKKNLIMYLQIYDGHVLTLVKNASKKLSQNIKMVP